jgi:hypothetical protein
MVYIPIENFLEVLHDAAPAKVDALAVNRRKVDYGLLPVGLKVHCLKNGEGFSALVEKLGGAQSVLERNLYRRQSASFCLVLPPVGSARYAILFLECIERYTGVKLFENRDFQIQVCSPGRLDQKQSGLLTIGFYLGSDVLRGYNLKDLQTTFSDDGYLPRGRRITIYDGNGELDQNFEWWTRKSFRPEIRRVRWRFPFLTERTDVLTCTSRVDIENVNLIATLLLHRAQYWFWDRLGGNFIQEMLSIIDSHQLMGHLSVPWVRREEEQQGDDERYQGAINEIMAYALKEVVRLNQKGETGGILLEVRDVLARYRASLIKQARALNQGGQT